MCKSSCKEGCCCFPNALKLEDEEIPDGFQLAIPRIFSFVPYIILAKLRFDILVLLLLDHVGRFIDCAPVVGECEETAVGAMRVSHCTSDQVC